MIYINENNTMKSLFILFTLSASFLLTVSCSDEDDLVSVPDTLTDCFAPAADANDPESQLRRDFYNSQGSFLLFNDTLRHEPIGTAPDGSIQYFTELLDIDYTIGSDKNIVHQTYTYQYLKSLDAKRKAVDLLVTKIIALLPSSMRPFSWLLVEGIFPKGKNESLPAVSGQRCIAAALGSYATEEEQKAAIAAVLAKVISSGLDESLLDEFCAISADNYEGYDSSCTQMEKYWELGFLVKGLNWNGVPTNKYLPTKQQDVDSYMQLVIQYSADEVEQQYADYPLVIEKATMMRSVLKQLGINI